MSFDLERNQRNSDCNTEILSEKSNFDLPTSLEVGGKEFPINTDFRDILVIFSVFDDDGLSDNEKSWYCLYLLYKTDDIYELGDLEEAAEKARWFLDWGKDYKCKEKRPKILDWEKDYNSIISAVNQQIKTVDDVRDLPYLHWWTFLGYFSERSEKCHLSTVLKIREKLAKGTKLEKWEMQTLRENREEIVIDNDEDFETELWGD